MGSCGMSVKMLGEKIVFEKKFNVLAGFKITKTSFYYKINTLSPFYSIRDLKLNKKMNKIIAKRSKFK